MVDAMAIFHEQHPRDLSAAVRLYCGRPFPEAHAAQDDVRAAMDVLHAQLEHHPELPRSVGDLDVSSTPTRRTGGSRRRAVCLGGGRGTICSGATRGRPCGLASAEPDYLAWMLDTDFAPDVQEICQAALRGELPRRLMGNANGNAGSP